GLAQELKAALAAYTECGGTGRTALDQDEAVAVMRGLDPRIQQRSSSPGCAGQARVRRAL
ncbi:MAG: hypothetical protein L0Y57_11910, partial [Beijerinckiaceae bacterium]|nr:hypothetical protein [Beijerinckiaceae bacterium]